MVEHGNSEGLRDPTEKELDIQLGTVEAIKDLRERVLHLETLDPVPSGVPTVLILDIDVAEVDVINTVVETTVYTVSVDGGVLGTANAIHLFLEGKIKNTSGVGKILRVRTKYGGATILDNTPSIPNGIDTQFQTYILIFANGTASSQKGQFIGRYNTGNLGSARGTSAIDSTIAQTLEVTVKWNVASPDVNFGQREAILKHYLTP